MQRTRKVEDPSVLSSIPVKVIFLVECAVDSTD